MGLPLDYVASREGNLFEAISTDPDRLALDAFLYGIAHQCHLASEVRNVLYIICTVNFEELNQLCRVLYSVIKNDDRITLLELFQLLEIYGVISLTNHLLQ
jgi:hypothetical protein